MKLINYGVVPDKVKADNLYIHSKGADNFPFAIDTPCILIGLFDDDDRGETFIEITKKQIQELIETHTD